MEFFNSGVLEVRGLERECRYKSIDRNKLVLVFYIFV